MNKEMDSEYGGIWRMFLLFGWIAIPALAIGFAIDYFMRKRDAQTLDNRNDRS